MPNAFTRVPDRPVPALPAWARLLLPVADAFMVAMWSRPPSGTLRTTWVTPATLQLSLVTAAIALLADLLLAVTGVAVRSLGAGLLAILLLALGVGSAVVAAVALAQRAARQTAPARPRGPSGQT